MPAFLLRWIVRAALAGAVLLYWPGLTEQFEVPKTWFVRTLGLGAGAGILIGFALDRWRPRRPRLGVVPAPASAPDRDAGRTIDTAMGVWLAVELLTTLTSVSPRISVIGDPMQREGLLTSLAIAGCYAAARIGHRNARDLGTTFAWLVVPAAMSCVYAMLQAARLDPVPWGRVATYGTLFRPFGTLGHPNLLGIVTGAASVWSLDRAIERVERRWLHVPALVLFSGATILTFSRGAWLGLTAGCAVALVMMWRLGRQFNVSRRDLLLGIGGVALVVGLFAAGGWGQLFGARTAEFESASTGSAGSRMEIWRTAIAAWRARPLLGHGPDTFELMFPRFQTARYWSLEWLGLPFHAHSIYLQTLATRGLLGLLSGIGVLIALLWAAGRVVPGDEDAHALLPALGGIFAVLAAAGGFGALGVSGALLAAVCAAGLGVLASHAPPNPKSIPPPRAAALVGAVAIAALTAVAAMRECAASSAAAAARHWSGKGNHPAAIASLEAFRLDPFEDAFERVRAETYLTVPLDSPLAADAPSLAAAAARRAIALTPARELAHARLAEALGVQASRGDTSRVPEMEAAFQRAFALAPNDVVLRAENARYELIAGRLPQALELASAAVRIDSTMADAHLVRAEALARLGRLDEAAVSLTRALNGEWHGVEARRNAAIRLAARMGLRAVHRD